MPECIGSKGNLENIYNLTETFQSIKKVYYWNVNFVEAGQINWTGSTYDNMETLWDNLTKSSMAIFHNSIPLEKSSAVDKT